MGFLPLAINASTSKLNKLAARSERKRIRFTPSVMEHLHGAGSAQMSPTHCGKDCGIARRCKLFLGAELERGARVLGYPFAWPPWNAAENPKRQTRTLSLSLSVSATCDGFCLGSRTPQ